MKRAEGPARKARVANIAFPASDVAVVDIVFLDSRPFNFAAGQYVSIGWEDERTEHVLIASNQTDKLRIQLHVRRGTGAFADSMFGWGGRNKHLTIEGPFGDFLWATPDNRPVILLATETGFAPMKSFIESHALWARFAPIYLYWSGQGESDIYLADVAWRWSESATHINFVPCLSSVVTSHWLGRFGRLGDVVAQDHAHLGDYDAYVCGPSEEIRAAREVLVETLGLNPERFFGQSLDCEVDEKSIVGCDGAFP